MRIRHGYKMRLYRLCRHANLLRYLHPSESVRLDVIQDDRKLCPVAEQTQVGAPGHPLDGGRSGRSCDRPISLAH